MKRFFSLLLALTMIFSMVPTATFAAEAEETEPALVTEPEETIAVPETTEAPATEAETEEPTTEATEAETIATEPDETEASIEEIGQVSANAPVAYMVVDGFELEIQLPRVDMNLDQLPEDEDRFFEVIDFDGVECIRNYIGKTDPNGGPVEEVPGDYQGFDSQWLAAVLEFEGVAENGVLAVFDENTTVIINGTRCTTELLDEGTRIRVTYVYQLQTIEVYNIRLNIPAPVAGEEAVFEAEYASPTDDRYEIGAGEGISATNGIRWIVGDSQKALKPGDKFESGHYYKALIYIKAGIGCRFAANVDATVSGAVDVYVSPYYSTETYDQYDPDIYRVVVAEFNLEGEYDIYVENGFAYSQDGDLIGSAKPGDIVTLKLGEPTEENWSFDAWEVVTPDNSIFAQEDGDQMAETTIVMPAQDIHVQCCFWYTDVEEVNFTLGGYGIGSYVDCLTVSEDAPGIELGANGRYNANYAIYDGPKGTPNSMLPIGTVIEEGEVYWLVGKLNPVSGYELYNLYQENIKLNGEAAAEIYRNDDGSIDVAFLLPAPAQLPTGRIAVENGYAALGETTWLEEAPVGALVQLCAVVPDELAETHRFSHWEIVKGDVEFNVEDPFASFVMPEDEVSLKAVYLPQVWDVYVTMNLPEVGETPVYTAESLTEGVSIGEITWHNTSATYEKPVGENDVLDYDQGYRVRIELLIDDEHVFAENVSGYMNGEMSGMYIDENGNWFLDYYYYTGSRKYSITVDGGVATDMNGNVITKAAIKEQFRITAEVPEGYAFDHWEVPQGRVIVSWPEVWNTSAELECYMLEEDVVFQAVFTALKDVPIMIVDGNGGDLNPAYDYSTQNRIEMLVRKGMSSYYDQEGDVTWTTSSAAIATVERADKNYWELVFHKPGTVTVTAKDAYGCKDSIKITGYYIDKATKFTVSTDVPSIGLQVGEWAQMNIFGADTENPLSPVLFDYTVSNEGIVDVHEGRISGIAPGSVTITAKLRNDPAGRKVTLKVTVIESQVEDIHVNVSNFYVNEEVYNGYVPEYVGNYTILYVDADDFADKVGTFKLTPKVKNTLGCELKLTKSLLKWTSSNTKAAKVTANADGTATVTIPKKASGMARITLTANDKAKTEQIFVLHIRDYTPKLAETKFTLDWWKQPENSYVPLNLTESYGNTIMGVTVTEYNRVTKLYDVSSPNFQVRQEEDGSFSIGMLMNPAQSKGTVKASLNVTCADGKTYKYLISITVQNKQPKVTLNQTQKLDTFYKDSEAPIFQVISGSDIPVVDAIKAVGDNKTITTKEGSATLVFTEAFKNGEIAKVDPNVVLEVKCVGYKPFEMKFKVATQTRALYVVTDPGTLTVTAANTGKIVAFKLLDRDTHENLSGYLDHVFIEKSAYLSVKSNNNGTPDDKTDDYLTAVFSEAVPDKTATYSVSLAVKKDNWRDNHGNVYKIKYIPGVPTVTLNKKALSLNTTFTEREDKAVLTLSDTGMNIRDLDFELSCVDKGGTQAFFTAQMLSVVCTDGVITAKFKDPDSIPAAAKCTFSGTPVMEGMRLPKITVTVNVQDDNSKVTITGSTVKLNKYLAGREIASVSCIASNGLQMLGFKENGNEFVDISYSNGQIHAKLKRSDAAAKYTFELTPKVKDPASGQIVYLAKKVKITVSTYTSDKVGIQVSYSGKLDTLNPESVMTAFVSKVTNAAAGHHILKSMTGADADLFTYSEDAEGQITLRPKQGYAYSVKESYEVAFVYDVFGELVTSNPVKIKFTQGTYKAVITPASALYSLASRSSAAKVLTFRVSLQNTDYAKLDANSIQVNTATPLALRRAMGAAPVVRVSEDGKTALVLVSFKHSSYLDYGKAYKLVLDVKPVGSASDVKAQTVTATINVH